MVDASQRSRVMELNIRKIRHDLFRRFIDASIRTKIIGLVLLCILISSAALISYTAFDSQSMLKKQAKETGLSLTDGLARQSLAAFSSQDYDGIQMAVNDINLSQKNISYIFVQDSSGAVLAQSSQGPVITDLADIARGGTGQYPLFSTLKIDGHEIMDIAEPVGAGQGMVHVGLSLDNIGQIVATHISHIMLWLILVVAIGLSLAFILSREMTRPIYALAAEARELGHGSRTPRRRRWGRNEIGELGRAFDEMSDEINNKEQMRRQLMAQVLSAQEDERKRVARELHDETSQSLTSLLVELKVAEKECNLKGVKDKLSELRSLAHRTLDDVHSIAMELRPNVLDDLGLYAALEKYVLDFTAKTGIQVDLQITDVARQRWPSDIETAAYRIMQEALSNVIRYARATSASIVVGCHDDRFSLIVEDNGVGFDVDEAMGRGPDKKLGLFGMYERASLVGGTLVIESEPGQGTSVFFDVPIKDRGK